MSSNLERHTAHSKPSFEPLSEENLKKGSDSMMVLSTPENRALDPTAPFGPCRRSDGSDLILWQNLAYARMRKVRQNMMDRTTSTTGMLGRSGFTSLISCSLVVF